jgi:hypothetical protein
MERTLSDKLRLFCKLLSSSVVPDGKEKKTGALHYKQQQAAGA